MWPSSGEYLIQICFSYTCSSNILNFFKLGEEKPSRVTYVPPAPPEEEEEIFQTIQQGINFDNYDSIAVEITGRDPVKPISSFEEADLYDTFKTNVKKANYVKPTPVQKYSIPAILSGRDLMACAQTGSGKTVSFLLFFFFI